MPAKKMNFQSMALFFILDALMVRSYKWSLDKKTLEPDVLQYLKDNTKGFPLEVTPSEFSLLFDPWVDKNLPVLIKMAGVNDEPVTVYPV